MKFSSRFDDWLVVVSLLLTATTSLVHVVLAGPYDFSGPTGNCSTHVNETGIAIFCCDGVCRDGNGLGIPGTLCQNYTSFCDDSPGPPQCERNQWFTIQEFHEEATGEGFCYLESCEWSRTVRTWSCCDCPERFIGVTQGKCDDDSISINRYSGCVGCRDPTENITVDESGEFHCVPSFCFNPEGDTCDFYPNCLDASYPSCGADGYAQSFGFPLCQLWTESLSSAGQVWGAKVRACLQKALAPLLNSNASNGCEGVNQFAFSNHAKCYVDSGLCTLPPKDYADVLLSLNDKNGINGTNVSAWAQATKAAFDCGPIFFRRITGAAIADFVFVNRTLPGPVGNEFEILKEFYNNYLLPNFPPPGFASVPQDSFFPWSFNRATTTFRVVFVADNLASALGIAQAMATVFQNAAPNGQPFGSLSLTFLSSVAVDATQTRAPTKVPTSKPTTAPTTRKPVTVVVVNVPSGKCFSGASTLHVDGKGVIPMKDIKIGDFVKDSQGQMTQVYSFGHYQPHAWAEYLEIHARGLPKPLEISRDHMLFINGSAIPASKVRVGDRLVLGECKAECESSGLGVTKIKHVWRMGAYAPFTMSGSMLVNGVATSCYVTLQEGSSVLMLGNFQTWLSMHWLAHMSQAFHRLVCVGNMKYCMAEAYTEDGISRWVAGPWKMSTWLMRQSTFVAAAIFVPFLVFVMVIYALELICYNVFFLLVVTTAVAWQFSTSQKIKTKMM